MNSGSSPLLTPVLPSATPERVESWAELVRQQQATDVNQVSSNSMASITANLHQSIAALLIIKDHIQANIPMGRHKLGIAADV